MTQKNRRAYGIAALVLAVSLLLTGCALKDIPVIGVFFQKIEELGKDNVVDSPEVASQPAQTNPVETEPPQTSI